MKIKRKEFIEEFCKQHCGNMSCGECFKNPCCIVSEINNTINTLKKKKGAPAVSVDWDKIPKWVQWVAMDEKGYWYGYEAKPFPSELYRKCWDYENKACNVNVKIETTGKMDWKKSLIRRPVGKE